MAMTRLISGNTRLMNELIKALGLDGRNIRRLRIEAGYDQITMVDVEMDASEDELGRVVQTFETFRVRAIGPEPTEA